MSPKPWALVPAKGFARGKSRLAPLLGAAEREALAHGFFAHMLDVLGASDVLGSAMIVTDCEVVAELARRRGALAVRDEASSLSGIVDAALVRIHGLGPRGVLVFMSDLPDIAPRDVRDLARGIEELDVVVAPDLRQEGTNALAIAPSRRFPTCFGHADSFARHLARASALGLRVKAHASERLGFDVDLPSDLISLRNRNRASWAGSV